jgi:hypothetical protein
VNDPAAVHCAHCGCRLDAGVSRWADWICIAILTFWLVQFGWIFIRALT